MASVTPVCGATMTTGSHRVRQCSYYPLSYNSYPGEFLGVAGGDFPDGGGLRFLGLDWGLIDTRRTSGFVDVSLYSSDRAMAHGVCPVDYTTPGLHDELGARFSDPTGTIPVPDCGTFVEDGDGSTAQGNWFNVNDYPPPLHEQGPHVALAHDNIYRSLPVISLGATLKAPASEVPPATYYFAAQKGNYNVDFPQLVTGTGTGTSVLGCYQDLFMDRALSYPATFAAPTVIFIGLTGRDLYMEAKNQPDCLAAPFTGFTPNAQHFQR
jgi:hypothetical protein